MLQGSQLPQDLGDVAADGEATIAMAG